MEEPPLAVPRLQGSVAARLRSVAREAVRRQSFKRTYLWLEGFAQLRERRQEGGVHLGRAEEASADQLQGLPGLVLVH